MSKIKKRYLDFEIYEKYEVDTISGSLSSEIDSDITTHAGDDDHTQYILANGSRAFTGTVGGIDPVAGSDLATKDYVDTVSGSLQQQVDAKPDSDHIHDSRYYTESEVDTISGSLQIQIDAKPDSDHGHDHGTLTGLTDDDHTLYVPTDASRGFTSTVSGIDPVQPYHLSTRSYVDAQITSVSGKLDDHDELNNLDYASSAHTGFAPTVHIHTTISGGNTHVQVIDEDTGRINFKVDDISLIDVTSSGTDFTFPSTVPIPAVSGTRLSTVDGTAFAWVDGTDLTNYLNKKIIFRDSSGKQATGWIKEADAAEALESDLFDPGAGTLASGTYSWNPWSSNTIENDANTLKTTYVNSSFGSANYLRDASDLTSNLTVGKLYKLVLDAKVNTGSVGLVVDLYYGFGGTVLEIGPTLLANTSFNTFTLYFTAENAAWALLYSRYMGTGESIWLDNLVLTEVTDVGTIGVHIVSSMAGSTRNWTLIDSGFNPNDISSIEILDSSVSIDKDGLTVTGETSTDSLNVSGLAVFNDNVLVDGGQIGITSDPDLLQLTANQFEVKVPSNNMYGIQLNAGSINVFDVGSEGGVGASTIRMNATAVLMSKPGTYGPALGNGVGWSDLPADGNINLKGNVGIGTATPDRKLDILDSADPQLRLTNTDGSIYTDFKTDGSGYLNLNPTGSGTIIDGKLTVEKDTGGLYDANTIAAVFGDSDNADNLYITGNTINMGLGYNNEPGNFWINFRGYNGGSSKYRDLYIGDGRGVEIASFTGSTGLFELTNNLLVNGGDIGITADPDLLSMAANTLTINGTLTGGAGAHVGQPILRLTQETDTSYNIGDIHSEIQFYTEDAGGDGFPGIQAYIRAITTRGDGLSWPDAGLVFGVSAGDGLAAIDYMTIAVGGNITIVNDLRVDGGDIGITSDTNLMQLAANSLTVNGTVTIATDLRVDGGDIGLTSDTNLMQLATNSLTVNGNIIVKGTTVGADIRDPNTSVVGGIIRVKDNSGTDKWGFGLRPAAGGLTNDLHFTSYNGGWANRLTIGQDGDIGIGELAPAAKLDINGDLILQNGTSINEFSTDGTLADNSDDAVPTERAVKVYVDTAVSGTHTHYDVDMTYVADSTWSYNGDTFGSVPSDLQVFFNGVKSRANDSDYYTPTVSGTDLVVVFAYPTSSADWTNITYTK